MSDQAAKTLSDMTEPELSYSMLNAIRAAKHELPATSKIVLLACDHSQICQYISNCQRRDMIKFLRETADRLESREDVSR